jgi:hypothetical protein
MPERLWARCRIKRDAPNPPSLGLGVTTQLSRNVGNGEAMAQQLVEAPFKKQRRRMGRRRMVRGMMIMIRSRRRRRRIKEEAKEKYAPRVVIFKMYYFVRSSSHVVSYNSRLKPKLKQPLFPL